MGGLSVIEFRKKEKEFRRVWKQGVISREFGTQNILDSGFRLLTRRP